MFPSELKEKVFIKHINGPLFFGSTSSFEQLSKQIPESAEAVIIRMGRVSYIDQSGLYAMEDVLIDLTNQGKIVHLVGPVVGGGKRLVGVWRGLNRRDRIVYRQARQRVDIGRMADRGWRWPAGGGR